jgi:hypothetical protein
LQLCSKRCVSSELDPSCKNANKKEHLVRKYVSLAMKVSWDHLTALLDQALKKSFRFSTKNSFLRKKMKFSKAGGRKPLFSY